MCEEEVRSHSRSQISICDEEGQAENSWQGGQQWRDNQAQGKEDHRESPESGQQRDVMSGRRQQRESGKYSVNISLSFCHHDNVLLCQPALRISY